MPTPTTGITADFSAADYMAATAAAVHRAMKDLRANTSGPGVFGPGRPRLRPYALCWLRKSQRASARRQRFELNRFISGLRLRHADDAKHEVWLCHYDRRGLALHDSYGLMLRDAKRPRTRDELAERLMRADLRAQLRRREVRFNSSAARFAWPGQGVVAFHSISPDGEKMLVAQYSAVVLHLDLDLVAVASEASSNPQEPSA